ncbi:hypothetical protein [Sodalis ligni]|uniref:hypothetical protein n=1 Tax=Sodalis ligni TaxID=2697027 RepID=UPI001FB78630|nr:hypothetical protein [Sodalis ligni]
MIILSILEKSPSETAQTNFVPPASIAPNITDLDQKDNDETIQVKAASSIRSAMPP